MLNAYPRSWFPLLQKKKTPWLGTGFLGKWFQINKSSMGRIAKQEKK